VNAPRVDESQPERREARLDRRVQRTSMFSRYWLVGRRRGPRRGSDATQTYVDRYTGYEWGLAVSVVALSLCDLLLTLLYLSLGGEERNPIMATMLDHSQATFIGVKSLVSVLGALFLLAHIRFPKVRRSLSGIVVLYILLIVYHLVTWVPAVLGWST
jgi:hypothetical protein